MLREKNKLCVQIMLLFWAYKTHTPILNGIVFLVTAKIFLEKSNENKAGKLGLAYLRCVFAKFLMYEHYS